MVPLLVVLTGPSGVGKDAVFSRMRELGRSYHFAVTATTRPKRDREVDGDDYIFLSEAQLREMIDHEELIEWAEVYGNLYGTPKEPIERNRTRGVDTILAIEIQGARSIRRAYPKAITIFIQPPSLEVLEQRLRDRGSDPEKTVEKRLSQAQIEMDWIDEYRYAIVNDEFDRTVGDLKAIITAERCRVRPAPDGLST